MAPGTARCPKTFHSCHANAEGIFSAQSPIRLIGNAEVPFWSYHEKWHQLHEPPQNGNVRMGGAL
jgi:hypothetical protein